MLRFLSSNPEKGFLVPTLVDWQHCSSSFRSDAQALDTSMPIAWIPGRYGNGVVPTQICILSSLWSPWSPILMGAEVLLEETFSVSERWNDGRERGVRRTGADRGGHSQINTCQSPEL